jgi:tRNA (guanine26-N2/guanine27-N2)-dimethyltransferase
VSPAGLPIYRSLPRPPLSRESRADVEARAFATHRKTALVYYCHTCQSPHWQPFGRVQERVSEKNGNVNLTYHVPAGPPEQVKGDRCSECGGKFHVRSREKKLCMLGRSRALFVLGREERPRVLIPFCRLDAQIGGPMWAAPLHNKAFVRDMLTHVEEHASDFKTSDRIKGMLTVALSVSGRAGFVCAARH